MKSLNQLGVAIIGCGLIGKKRFNSLSKEQVVYTCDLVLSRAEELARQGSACIATQNSEEVLRSNRVQVVVVATLNSELAPIALSAVRAGKHVLVEKPGAISVEQLVEIQKVALDQKVHVRIGYNHRYHPAFLKAYEIYQSGALGPLMMIRGRYGHGGRIGYDREWRANPSLSGGGELIDQGVHLIDLASWFLGPFTQIEGHASTLFWDMAVDDNAFISLRNELGRTAWLQVSCTEWKNLFSFELYGRNAKLQIEGLGGSYGVERLHYYKMLPEMGPPETLIYEFPRGDQSWKIEMNEFLEDISLNRAPHPGLEEGISTLHVVEEIYKKSGYLKSPMCNRHHNP